MKKNILIISPHADDEILGCGGTIAKYVKLGYFVYIAILTNANLGDPKKFPKSKITTVRNEALKSHSYLGIKKTIFFDFPAPNLHNFDNFKIANEIEKLLFKIKPIQIFIPFPGDLHLDHQAIYRASLVAARARNNKFIKNILCYEVMSETECIPNNINSSFKPNYFIEIDKYFNNKIKALKYYKSQLHDFPHPRSLKAIQALAEYRGSTINVNKAEAFSVERLIE